MLEPVICNKVFNLTTVKLEQIEGNKWDMA
jgi:hypothetical protein